MLDSGTASICDNQGNCFNTQLIGHSDGTYYSTFHLTLNKLSSNKPEIADSSGFKLYDGTCVCDDNFSGFHCENNSAHDPDYYWCPNCFREQNKNIPSCECHESFGFCGYDENPFQEDNCTICADGLFIDTGLCGSHVNVTKDVDLVDKSTTLLMNTIVSHIIDS